MRSRLTSTPMTLWCVVGLAVVAAGCRGDVPNEPRSEQAEAFDDEDDQARSATLTGCLQQGKIPGTFVLTSANALDVPEEVGTSGKDADEAPVRTYALINLGDTDLTRHVGSQVTVGGRFQPEDNDPPSLERAPELAERRGVEPDTPELIVESVEPVGERCQ